MVTVTDKQSKWQEQRSAENRSLISSAENIKQKCNEVIIKGSISRLANEVFCSEKASGQFNGKANTIIVAKIGLGG